jgi:Dolichyl-phosphate-mannose-protein mannosyltransferase
LRYSAFLLLTSASNRLEQVDSPVLHFSWNADTCLAYVVKYGGASCCRGTAAKVGICETLSYPVSHFTRIPDSLNKRIKYTSIALFLLALLLLGLSIYRDYGISWDEANQRLTGAVTVKYLAEMFHIPASIGPRTQRVPSLADYRDRDYGVAFEAPAFALEQIFPLTDSRDIYMFRHLLTFLVFFGGVCAVYRLSERRFLDWRAGLLSALFLILTPRFFAESFYNSKDIVFMAVFAAAMNTTVSFVLQPRVKTALIHALATAVAIDVRIMAILLVAASVILLLIRIGRRELQFSRTCLVLAAYVIGTSALVILMWPYLWPNPLLRFWEAFRHMRHFRWGGEVRYMGALIRAKALPWHYSFTWISITTPVLYLAFFVIGMCATCRQIVARRMRFWHDDTELQDVLFLGLFFAPLVAVILFHSVLYDGWRQLYFVYPAFLLVATRGWMSLWSAKSNPNVCKAGLIALTAISFFSTAFWMWKAHPLQNAYFNILAGNNIISRYDIDYWGLANRKALEYILENDNSPIINVCADKKSNPLGYSFLMLKHGDRARLRLGDEKQAPDYVVANHPFDANIDRVKYGWEYKPFYEIRVGSELVLSVFKWSSNRHNGEFIWQR